MKPTRRPPGELEAHVMRVLWDAPDGLTAKQIGSRIPGVAPAHTTVLTALDRLSAKSMVRRIGEELRDIRFATVLSEEEHVSQAMLTRLGSSSDREAALLHFAGHLDVEDLQVLRRAVERGPRD